ncbi:hypothetical protein Vadar_007812 [Vaccinium darrowii]|uniref:Uncharacterized protein n=1 Tax=Vaccinium darrowii TaxID=229202 RepID=A0ACB7XZ05_9ERIC|nr:hypothetical protein Vadar_007812 [Vaccinium darrowii]
MKEHWRSRVAKNYGLAFPLLQGSSKHGKLLLTQQQFEQSPAGKAARAQIAAAAKQSANPNRGEPVLKWQMG